MIQLTMQVTLAGRQSSSRVVLPSQELTGPGRQSPLPGCSAMTGRRIKDIEYPGGFSDGVILPGGEIELIFRDRGKSLDDLHRSAPTVRLRQQLLRHRPSRTCRV